MHRGTPKYRNIFSSTNLSVGSSTTLDSLLIGMNSPLRSIARNPSSLLARRSARALSSASILSPSSSVLYFTTPLTAKDAFNDLATPCSRVSFSSSVLSRARWFGCPSGPPPMSSLTL